MSLSWPVEGTISQQFGSNPNSIQPNGHTGVDFAIPEGTPIYAADSGNIAFEGWATTLSSSNPWWIAPAYAGILVIINHNDGFYSVYGHMSSTSVDNGQFVEKGQLIGYSGTTGLATGPHLHFEIFTWPLQPYNGYYGRVNPNNYCSGFAGSTIQYQASTVLAPNQRKVGENNINQRAQPNTTAEIVRVIQANTVETFTGFVWGEYFGNTNIWYKDDQGYAWAGAFSSMPSTDGLPNLTPEPALKPNARKVGSDNVNQRLEANTSSPVIRVVSANTVEEFTGFVRGENVNGIDIWFKDDQGYVWAGGFQDSSTNNLVDLTPEPAPTVKVTERTLGDSKTNIRREPNTASDIVGTAEAGSIINFDAYVVGQMIDAFNVWFKNSNGYMWSGAFTSQATDGLSFLGTITPEPESTPQPTKYSFEPAFDFVEVIPAALVPEPNEKFQFGNFPDKPTHAVIHQFGKPGVDTLNSLINTFTNPTARQASAHFAVSGKRIVQLVSLKDRAYHAGPVGNNYVGIETDPAQDAETIASTKKLLRALKDHYGYELTTILHQKVPGNNTTCGDLIDLSNYTLTDPVTPPVTEPPVTTLPVTPPTVDERAIIENFIKWLLDEYFAKK